MKPLSDVADGDKIIALVPCPICGAPRGAVCPNAYREYDGKFRHHFTRFVAAKNMPPLLRAIALATREILPGEGR